MQLRAERWGYNAALYIADTRYRNDNGETRTEQQADGSSVFGSPWFHQDDLDTGFAAAVNGVNRARADGVVLGDNPDLLLDRGWWALWATCRRGGPLRRSAHRGEHVLERHAPPRVDLCAQRVGLGLERPG